MNNVMLRTRLLAAFLMFIVIQAPSGILTPMHAAPDTDPTASLLQPGETSTPTAGSDSAASETSTPTPESDSAATVPSTPTPESDSAPTVAIQLSSPSGELSARASSAAEAQAPAANFTLHPNQDGWPDTNPLLVQVTLTCPGGGPHCIYPMTFKFYSNDGGRFWVYDRPGEPDCGCAEVVEETGPYSLKSYTAFSYGVFVGAGTQRMLQWSVWAQPSPQSTMLIAVTWNLTTPFVIAVEQMRIHPLVFIPGILGTMPPTYEAAGAMDPILGSYAPLLTNLEKLGFERNKSFFPFPVDWRQSNAISAEQLAAAIPGFLQTANQLGYVGEPTSGPPATKVDLVVHSMGGLVTRMYVQGNNYHNDVHKVIFIATPHRGFPADYRTREGLTWGMYLYQDSQLHLAIAMDKMLWPTMIGKRYEPSAEEMETAGCGNGPLGDRLPYIYCSQVALYDWSHDDVRGALSLLEMLPDESVDPYLRCGDGSGLECTPEVNYPFGRETNPILDGPNSLNALDRLQTLANNVGGPQNIYVIFGNGTTTDHGYFVRSAVPPLWAHGRPEVPIYGPGDDLIPTYSANFSLIMPGIPAQNVVELFGAEARHKEIMYHPEVLQHYVPMFLTGMPAGFPPTEYSSPLIPVTGEVLAFVFNCPVNLTITDPQGRRVGFDPATGGSFVEIEGASYAAPGAEGQFILIPNPEQGAYQITGTAFGDGEYLLSASRLGPDGVITLEVFSGEVTQGQVVNFEVDNSQEITPTPTDTPMATDTPSATPTDTATATPTDTATATPTPTPTATSTNTSTPTATRTPKPTATRTPRPTATRTPRPTSGLIQALDNLKERIKEYEQDGKMTERLERSLLAKVQAARYFVQHHRYHAAADKLKALIHQVEDERGEQITRAAAADLTHRAKDLVRRLSDDNDDDDDDGDDDRDDDLRGRR